MTTANNRHSQYDIDPMFLQRWSPRAFDGQPMPKEDLLAILDAARWAPSASNSQPWRFVYAQRNTAEFDRMLGLLIDFNQDWAKAASALVFVFSQKLATADDGSLSKPIRNHSFDTGTAWGYLALQSLKSGYFAHGMTGVHFERASAELAAPEEYHFEAAIAIGRLGNKDDLSEKLREREIPNNRKPLSEIAFEGSF
ncbi:nitroreductase family protein [Rhizobium sp. G187]|uniref:nitroreductase family protein n=1 Tax=Rhizobium sp. G187 TaxID=3451352 RepID=UPI003EE4C609